MIQLCFFGSRGCRSVMRKTVVRVLAVLFLGLALLLFSGALQRGYEALLMMGELGGYSPPALLQTRSRVSVGAVCLGRGARHYYADLYLPEDSPEAGIVLLHGATQSGKDDERLVAFARLLAGRRFAVLVPELSGPEHLRIRAEDAQDVVDAFTFLNKQPGLEGRVGIGGFSVSAGLAFLAALQPALRNEVPFILSVGGYHSMPRTLAYAITGSFSLDGSRQYRPPNAYAKWLFVVNNLDTLPGSADRQVMNRIAFRRMASPGADIGKLAAKLGPEGQRLLDYVTADNLGQIATRYARLPGAMLREVEALDLSDKPLNTLKGRILLVHGYDDPIIPYTESVSLFRSLRPGQGELFLVHGLQHVDSKLQRLGDFWRLWRAGYALLQERDRAAVKPPLAPVTNGAANQSVASATLSN
jgi:fermentation-respiration switch protein FrsA (DUF1100 family)